MQNPTHTMKHILSWYILTTLMVVALFLFALHIAHGQTTLSTDVTVGDGVHVDGTLSKGSGTFVIDHPLDPKNKLLYHSFVESPEAKNVYDGITQLDRNGRAVIELPDYFLALNKDVRYQVSAISEPMPDLHLTHDVEKQTRFFGLFSEITFEIAGGEPGGRVSWQVTGVRRDPFIQANPIIPEVEKGPEQLVEKGECLYEPLCE